MSEVLLALFTPFNDGGAAEQRSNGATEIGDRRSEQTAVGEGFGVDSDSDRDRRIQALFAFSVPVWTLLCGTGMFYVLLACIARIR